eukprot:123190-Hanusia_phi.AAC.1
MLATGCDDGTVRVWEVETGECRQTHSSARIRAISTSWLKTDTDDLCLIAMFDDGQIHKMDIHRPDNVKKLKGHYDCVFELIWSPDGQMLASVSLDSTIRIWEIQTGDCRQVLTGKDWMRSLSWRSHGKKMLSCSRADGSVVLSDADTRGITIELKGHTKWVESVSWGPDGRMLASGSSDKT